MKIETLLRGTVIVAALPVLSMQLKLTRSQTTPNFLLRAERNVSTASMTAAGKFLDRSVKTYGSVFGISLGGRLEAIIFNSPTQFRSASQSRAFDDADYRNGKLYYTVGRGKGKDSLLQHAADRVVVRALLDRIPACPQWFAEAYSLYVGRDLERFGRPVSVTLSSFSDLGEDYFRADGEQQVRDVYSKLAITIGFLESKYGDTAVREALLKFKSGASLDEVFEATFKEKLPDIEKAWLGELRVQSRG